jgi:flagellar basal-body rod protein FlgF
MDVSIYQAAAALNASSRWQEVISDNLAASQLPGYKKQNFSFNAVQAGYMTGTTGSKRASMPTAVTSTNFAAGELRPTGVSTDLGIEGPGYFQVQTSDGTMGYTRDGEFRLNTKGQLLTKHGFPVMGDNGAVQVDPRNTSPLVITDAGAVMQGGEQKARIKLTEFANQAALTTTSAGLFLDPDLTAQASDATKSSVRQGFLENANVSSIVEMGSLITAMRFYEANQRTIQVEDERLSRLISDVANPT